MIGKQKEITIKESLANLKSRINSNEEIINAEFSELIKNKNYDISPRSHGWLYQANDFDTIGKLSLKIDLQFWAISMCSFWVPCADLKWM